jgi:NOL1/NOP2/sun family putative RNA methylase
MPKRIPDTDSIALKPLFVQRYKALLGEDYDLFMEYSLSYLRKSIRINTLRAEVSEVRESLERQGFKLEQVPWCKEGFFLEHETGRRDIGCTLEHGLGYYYVQEAASMIPPVVLDPQENELILDMCASPGSKSTQIAQYLRNTGLLVSNDLTTKRIAPLSINLQRCGSYNNIITIMHGASFKRLEMEFDRILVDAPCSGVGAVRKSLKTLLIWNPQMIKRLSATQKALIESAFSKLKKGGTLVYSTCTLEPEENEGVISYLLNAHPDAQAEEINLPLKKGRPIAEWEGEKYHPDVSKTLRLWPQDNDTEGFFVARIRKL